MICLWNVGRLLCNFPLYNCIIPISLLIHLLFICSTHSTCSSLSDAHTNDVHVVQFTTTQRNYVDEPNKDLHYLLLSSVDFGLN